MWRAASRGGSAWRAWAFVTFWMDFKSAWVSPFLESWCYFSVYGKLKRNKAWLTTLRQIYVRGQQRSETQHNPAPVTHPGFPDLFFVSRSFFLSRFSPPFPLFPQYQQYYNLRARASESSKIRETRNVFLSCFAFQRSSACLFHCWIFPLFNRSLVIAQHAFSFLYFILSKFIYI